MTPAKGLSGPMGLKPANRSGLVRGLAVVGILGLGSAAAILALRGLLPDSLATHFGGSTPDGFESVTATAVVAASFSVGLGLVLSSLGAMVPGPRWMRRALFGLGIATAAFVAQTFLGIAVSQIGLEDAHDASIGWLVFVVPAAISAALGWALSGLIRD